MTEGWIDEGLTRWDQGKKHCPRLSPASADPCVWESQRHGWPDLSYLAEATPFWSNPIKAVGFQQGCAWCFKAVAVDMLLALVLYQNDIYGWKKEAAPVCPEISKAVPGKEPGWGRSSQVPRVADPHVIDALVGWCSLKVGI